MDATQAIRVQVGVLRDLDPGHNVGGEVAFIELYGGEIRAIIETFPSETGRDPTKDDIIWRLGQVIMADPRLAMRDLIYNQGVAQDHGN